MAEHKAPPPLQRRHFEYLAEVMLEIGGWIEQADKDGAPVITEDWRDWLERFADDLESSNPRFDGARFLRAARGLPQPPGTRRSRHAR